jgi:putative toxin-antitoxin system antitoxin component (TIGR02293 family)
MRDEVIELLGGDKAFARSALGTGKGAGKTAAHRVAEPAAAYGAGAAWSGAGFAVPATPLFKVAAVDNLARRLDIPPDDLLTILGITGRTAQRRRQEGMLAADESDRLYRLTRVVEKALEVLDSGSGAVQWLKRPQAFCEGAPPLVLLGSDAGAETVEHQLGRIEYGVYS